MLTLGPTLGLVLRPVAAQHDSSAHWHHMYSSRHFTQSIDQLRQSLQQSMPGTSRRPAADMQDAVNCLSLMQLHEP